ncbi:MULTISPECIES: histidinol-phosphate transaminase [unclassified Streptomyces]|uniref:histidinol-phosphate transaminase n=1 Tax=unclassified Streptomyces TaxID=2593676 RepID=UPI000DD9313F|nr:MULTISPECIES: histidinol-phosphate transaminase [unclassified Streptomyces]QZZ31042.1 histidinol-phosphate transaminase [Streptomyces sp. ST1015]
MYELLKTIMIEELEVEAGQVSPDASREDAGLDSLATFELSLELSRRLGVTIADEDLFALNTLADIAEFMEKRTGTGAAAAAEAPEDAGLARLLGTGDGIHAAPAHQLARNETPFPPPASVLDAITRAATEANRYPDPACGALRTALARHYGLTPDHVAVGAGSITLLQALLTVTAGPDAAVACSWPSFDGYEVLADLAGFRTVRVPLAEDGHDLAALAAAVDERTRLVLLCNPNNPTGATSDEAALLRFLDAVPRTCLVVLDEAYAEFAHDPGLGARLLAARPNLIVARTFSKAYGLAGLRVGYLLAEPGLISRVQRMVMPLSVSDVAQAAAVASLAAQKDLLARVQDTAAERDRVRAALLALGFHVPPSEANFLWLPLGDRAEEFAAACASAGVAVRPYPGDGVRVTVGTVADDDAFLAVAGTNRP